MCINIHGRRFYLGYEILLDYAIKKYDDAYYRKEKSINGIPYTSIGWRFDIDDFFYNVVGLNNLL